MRIPRLVVWILASMMILAACSSPGQGGASESQSSAPGSQSSEPEATNASSEPVEVRYALPVKIPDEGQIWAYVPEQMGFFAEENLKVDFVPAGSGGDALKLLGTGNAEFSVSQFENVLNGRTEGLDLVGIATLDTVQINRVFTLADSDISDWNDLRGKSIGVVSLTSGTYQFLRASLLDNGIDPDKDVTIVATGSGGPGLEALKSGQVAATSSNDTNIARYELTGAKFKFLPPTKASSFPADLLLTREDYLGSNPDVVARFARAVVKGIVYAQANPEAAALMQRKMFPEAAADSLEATTAVVKARVDSQHKRDDQQGWGWIPIDAYKEVQDAGLSLGTVREKQDVDKILTNQLMPQIQDFDPAEVQALPYPN